MISARFFRDLGRVFAQQTGQKRQIKADAEHADLGAVKMGLLYPKRANPFTESEQRVVDAVPDRVAQARHHNGA